MCTRCAQDVSLVDPRLSRSRVLTWDSEFICWALWTTQPEATLFSLVTMKND